MIWFASGLSLYCSTNSVAPENAIWLMYFLISSAVIPIPWSEIVILRVSLSTLTFTFKSSPTSPLYSPIADKRFSFWVASTAFETNSRRKISWSEYKNFLMIGKIFSVWIEMVPFSAIIFMLLIFKVQMLNLKRYAFNLKKSVKAKCAFQKFFHKQNSDRLAEL